MNEAMFEMPPEGGFVDKTVTYFEGTSPSGADVILLVERQPFPDGKDLRGAVQEHVSHARTRLRGYSIVFEREAEVGGLPGIDLAARWRDDEGELVYTRQTHLQAGPDWWIIVAGESPLDDAEFCDSYVNHVLSTMRPRT